jgi:imidazolonepropionase-like amidohydrolase
MLYIRGGTIIDVATGVPIEDAAIVVEGERIREMGPVNTVGPPPDSADVLDAHGSFIVPGLMDMHTHLCIPSTSWDPGSDDPPVTDASISLTSMYAVQNARNFILKGITTVRDVGCQHHGIFAVKQMIEDSRIVGPRVIPCGRAIAMTGGHGMIVATTADGADGVRKLARTELKKGAEALKFMASGAGAESRQDPYAVELTYEELAAGAEEARHRGKTTCAHSMNPESTRNAVQAGINSIEHGLLLDEATLRLMKENSTYYVPTVWTYQNTAENGLVYGVEDWMVAEVRRRVEIHLENVAKAIELGVDLAAGTDSGMPLNPPESLQWELQWLTYCGMSNADALRAATLNPARLLRLDGVVGTLAPGEIADIVIVAEDPLKDIRALSAPDIVIARGVVAVQGGELLRSTVVTPPRSVPGGPVPPPSWREARGAQVSAGASEAP